MFVRNILAFAKRSAQPSFFKAPNMMGPGLGVVGIGQHYDFSSKVFVKHIPSAWDRNEINARFGIVGKIEDIHEVKNEMGERSRQLIITYE